jgi:protein-tyrosine phosphatase
VRRFSRRATDARTRVRGRGGPSVEEELRQNGGMSFDRVLAEPGAFRICFVCTGNICRSPMAESVFRELIRARGWEHYVSVRSAGTGEWHVGEHSDPRTLASLRERGYDGGSHRARQFDVDWFASLDLVIVFDRTHERILKTWAPDDDARAKVHLLLSFDPEAGGTLDVPDPYYSDAAMFDSVLSMTERACVALFRQLEPGIRQGVS